MKHSLKLLLPALSLTLASCSFVKTFEKDLAYQVLVGDEVVQTGTINIFNNAVLPAVDEKMDDDIFYKWYLGDSGNPSIDDSDRLLPEEGLLRYNDHKKYATNNILTVQAIYLDPLDYPSPYLTIRWYARTRTSGIDAEDIERWRPTLNAFLAEKGATQEEIADVDIKGYDGAAADFGAAVNKDKVVDVIFGMGNNVNSQTGGGVTNVKEKDSTFVINGIDKRCVARLTDKPVAIAVYDWLTKDGGLAALEDDWEAPEI